MIRATYKKQPEAVSLFTGAGGLDIGVEQAGYSVVACVESDQDCIETLLANQAARVPNSEQRGRRLLEGTRVIGAPIEQVAASDLRPAGRRGRWTPDLLVGGPPCQPFSSAGKERSLQDPRGRLFLEFVRLAEELKPRQILFENVRGLVTARGPQERPGEVLMAIKQSFEDLGYATTFAVLNAADYGAPQRRVRLFMMAVRSGTLPEFPLPSHAENPENTLFGTELPWRTLGEFLSGRPKPDSEDIVVPTPRLAGALRDVPDGSGLRSAGARETTRPGGHWGYRQGTFIADLAKPARTVTAASTQDWVRSPSGRLRRLTLQECAALQGFPNSWRFCGSKASKFRQVGNAVQVRIAHRLATVLLEALAPGSSRRPRSAPLPPRILRAIDYTVREHRRNGESRRLAKTAADRTKSQGKLKGLGSQNR